jgi:hypothetical protein
MRASPLSRNGGDSGISGVRTGDSKVAEKDSIT